MDTRKYIIERMRHYNRHDYQMGFLTAEEIVFGLSELAALADAAGHFDLKDIIRKKSNELRELLLKKGTAGFIEFEQSI